MRLNSFRNMFVDQLRDIYDAEKQITKALPKMAKAAHSDELKAAFEQHLRQTEGHVARLEEIFTGLDEKPTGVKCEAMEGLIEEGDEIVEKRGESHVKDAALIAAAQRVEHYEISAYGTARTYARMVGMTDAAALLKKTLDEESNTDEKLTKLAEGGLLSSGINEKAMERA